MYRYCGRGSSSPGASEGSERASTPVWALVPPPREALQGNEAAPPQTHRSSRYNHYLGVGVQFLDGALAFEDRVQGGLLPHPRSIPQVLPGSVGVRYS